MERTNIERYLAYFDNLQSSEERKKESEKVVRELGDRATNVAVCYKDSVSETKEKDNRRTPVKKREEWKDIEPDDWKVLEQLIAVDDARKRFPEVKLPIASLVAAFAAVCSDGLFEISTSS
ncbi:hypothetical protein G7Y89_g12329 [Cudoniella acicularis]|uniref:Uncharacterized protein n=1 Tax=Cudoniella acicularis TaxID=354080 RepID=A0A8H4R9A3_9HELO|nr:hypothetical protein G7Y89_g12329 [Cudoniella acicularis]